MKNLWRSAGWVGRGACVAGLVSIGGIYSAAEASDSLTRLKINHAPHAAVASKRPSSMPCAANGTGLCVEAKTDHVSAKEYVWNILEIGSADFRGTAF